MFLSTPYGVFLQAEPTIWWVVAIYRVLSYNNTEVIVWNTLH